MEFVTRTTSWHDVAGNLVQISVAMLDQETWEAVSVVTEHVGPFDDQVALIDQTVTVAANLARGQYPGQQEMAWD